MGDIFPEQNLDDNIAEQQQNLLHTVVNVQRLCHLKDPVLFSENVTSLK